MSLRQEVVLQLAVRSPPSHRSWEMRAIFSLMFTFQRDGSQVLEKGILGHQADKSPISFSKGFIYISKREETTYNDKFSEVKGLRSRRERDLNREN